MSHESWIPDDLRMKVSYYLRWYDSLEDFEGACVLANNTDATVVEMEWYI